MFIGCDLKMDLKTSVGVCGKVQGELVIISQDVDMFKENQVVVLVAASDFENFTDEMKTLIKFVESAQTVIKDTLTCKNILIMRTYIFYSKFIIKKN